MVLNIGPFQEPRGVMRILQFIFSICAFATTTGFTNYIRINIGCAEDLRIDYEYPFQLDRIGVKHVTCNGNSSEVADFPLYGDFSSDSRFFVATGVLSMLYSLAASALYGFFNPFYQDNAFVPIADFCATAVLAIFWLSGSAAWSNGLAGLKYITSSDSIKGFKACKVFTCTTVYTGNFSTLNISLILGFLNFFLWASNLWFLYKETEWFKSTHPPPNVNTDAVA